RRQRARDHPGSQDTQERSRYARVRRHTPPRPAAPAHAARPRSTPRERHPGLPAATSHASAPNATATACSAVAWRAGKRRTQAQHRAATPSGVPGDAESAQTAGRELQVGRAPTATSIGKLPGQLREAWLAAARVLGVAWLGAGRVAELLQLGGHEKHGLLGDVNGVIADPP